MSNAAMRARLQDIRFDLATKRVEVQSEKATLGHQIERRIRVDEASRWRLTYLTGRLDSFNEAMAIIDEAISKVLEP